MTIALWIASILGALMFGMHGVIFLQPTRARAQLPYATPLGDGLLRTIGALEVLGALGLILPSATGIAPWLTPVAGLGLAAVMVLAIAFHVMRREWPNIAFNLVLGLIAAFVAYGRLA